MPLLLKQGVNIFLDILLHHKANYPNTWQEASKIGGVFLQAESELAAISMVYGAAGAGERVMTSSSSVGIALKQEGISHIAALSCHVLL